jgi:hypothetical protein
MRPVRELLDTPSYSCENWKLNRKDRTKTEAAEMKFLSSLAGYRLTDQKRNTDNQTELNIYHLGKEKIEHRKRDRYEHI